MRPRTSRFTCTKPSEVDGGCRTELLFTPAIDRAVPALFRRQFSVSDPEALHVVIADQAGCHLPVDDSRLPANLRRLPRPPYSPELNPVEPFGGLSKAAVSNRLDPLLSYLERPLDSAACRCCTPSAVVSLILGWMRDQANAAGAA